MSEPNVEYNSGGRPPKEPEEKRDKVIKCYVNEAEKEEIEMLAAAAGMTVSEFLRRLGLGTEVEPPANPKELKQIRAELGSIGGNINQIAKKVNQGEISDTTETDFRKLIEYLHKKLEEL